MDLTDSELIVSVFFYNVGSVGNCSVFWFFFHFHCDTQTILFYNSTIARSHFNQTCRHSVLQSTCLWEEYLVNTQAIHILTHAHALTQALHDYAITTVKEAE